MQGQVPTGVGAEWEDNVHGAQAHQAQHDLVTGVAACHALDAHKAGTLGFSFSGPFCCSCGTQLPCGACCTLLDLDGLPAAGGGFWFPYSLGSALMVSGWVAW
jgi:hypothetical protein